MGQLAEHCRAIASLPPRPGNPPRGRENRLAEVRRWVKRIGRRAFNALLDDLPARPAGSATRPPSARKSNRPPMSAAKRAALSAAMKMK